MASEFKKLISKELGRNNYDRYAMAIREGMQDKKVNLKEIFKDIYGILQDRDAKEIATRHDRLNESLLIAFRISRTYLFSLLFYAAAVIFLIVMHLDVLLVTAAIGIVTLIFLAKTYEFIVNKYCYIDAQIVLIYKAVLEKLILCKGMGKE